MAHLNTIVEAAVKGATRVPAVSAAPVLPLKGVAEGGATALTGTARVAHAATTGPPTPPVLPVTDPNWGGYTVTGGPFRSVSGTFMVPFLYDDGRCGEGLSNWVGVDGSSDNNLLQAGVQETYTDPRTGGCDPRGAFWVEAWWEVLPATETVVRSVQVHPGDSVTVSVSDTPAPGTWSVSLQDGTDGQGFTEVTGYKGPAASAEWVDEAFSEPAGTQCGSGVAPGGNGMAICPVAPYSGDIWTKLRVLGRGRVTGVERKTIVQEGVAVSEPSAVLNLPELLSRGFVDTYTGDSRA